MKLNRVFGILTAMVLIVCFTSVESKAQISAGAGLAYGLDIEAIGLQLNGNYDMSSMLENLRVGADLIIWFPEKVTGVDQTAIEFNINGLYSFMQKDALTLYGIATLGIHYAKVSLDLGPFGKFEDSDTELGLGVGVGAEYDLGKIKFFAEPRFFLSGYDQLQIGFGVRYGL